MHHQRLARNPLGRNSGEIGQPVVGMDHVELPFEVDVRAYDDLADSYTLVLRDQAGVVGGQRRIEQRPPLPQWRLASRQRCFDSDTEGGPHRRCSPSTPSAQRSTQQSPFSPSKPIDDVRRARLLRSGQSLTGCFLPSKDSLECVLCLLDCGCFHDFSEAA